MRLILWMLLIFLVVCAIAACTAKNILNSILIFMAYSLVMSIVWMIFESPDLAITEAAVGAGVTSVLFFVTLKKIHRITSEKEVDLADQEGREQLKPEKNQRRGGIDE